MARLTRPADRPDWRKRAACRGRTQEMVPTEDADTYPLEIQLAKKVCAGCPVTVRCLIAAEHLTTTLGADYAQGVWAGLTVQERATMAGLKVGPVPCSACGLDCVPINLSTFECIVCKPTARLRYDDYRPQIVALIEAGLSYHQVADQLRLGREAVTAACFRWKIRSRTASARKQQRVKECGTLAAKQRHLRHGETDQDCACKHVPWKKGKSRAGLEVE